VAAEAAGKLQGMAKRQRASGKTENEILQSAVQLLLKGWCHHDMLIMELCGAVYRTIRFTADNEIIVTADQAGLSYFSMVEKEGNAHGRGPAYLQIFIAVLEYMINHAKNKISNVAMKTLSEFWYEEVMRKPIIELAATIRMCRQKKLHDRKDGTPMRKLYLRFDCLELDTAFRSALTSFGGQELVGAPPKGEMAKAAQKLLQHEYFQ
jgi:hypothetical protein